jgi:hypothetical protein
MITRILPVLLLVATARPPDAGYYLYWRDGSVSYLPDELIGLAALVALVVGVAVLLACIDGATSSSGVTQMSLDLPEEIREPESVEQYEDMAARTRALKRKLDADTDLAESYIKAARTRAALDDLDETPGDDRRNGARGHGTAENRR